MSSNPAISSAFSLKVSPLSFAEEASSLLSCASSFRSDSDESAVSVFSELFVSSVSEEEGFSAAAEFSGAELFSLLLSEEFCVPVTELSPVIGVSGTTGTFELPMLTQRSTDVIPCAATSPAEWVAFITSPAPIVSLSS